MLDCSNIGSQNSGVVRFFGDRMMLNPMHAGAPGLCGGCHNASKASGISSARILKYISEKTINPLLP